jgi:exodeoxyribonuclease V alpha subunit
MGVTFAPEQQEALKTAVQNRVAIITDGPGTGKSTILKGLLLILAAKGVAIELAAPCGREARTIHRLLEYDPSIRGFKRNSEHPLSADLIIVDESSMLDIVLANSLFQAAAHGSSLLLVGDVDQLPSVGPGNVLRDCIESGGLPGGASDQNLPPG